MNNLFAYEIIYRRLYLPTKHNCLQAYIAYKFNRLREYLPTSHPAYEVSTYEFTRLRGSYLRAYVESIILYCKYDA